MMHRRVLLAGLAALPAASWARPPAKPRFTAGPVVATAGLPGMVAYARMDLPGEALGRLLAPVDLQAVKACGVTYVRSMLERVIEERARGNPDAAAAIRLEVGRLVGDDLRRLKPGSPEYETVRRWLEEGAPEPSASVLPSQSLLVRFPAAGSVEVEAVERARLEAFARELGPDATVVVTGHAEPSGDAVLERQLALERARAVAEVLVAAGVGYVWNAICLKWGRA